jgi:MYXO-CTERM domain-containing protein
MSVVAVGPMSSRGRHAGLRLVLASLLFLGALAAAAPVARADSSAQPQTFVALIGSMRLVILARVSGSPDTGFQYTIEQVFKGSASAPELDFGPDLQAAVQPGWAEAVIAFSNPQTDDFRAPTVAWHVGPDGTIDPEGYQQLPGLPTTLGAMRAFFGATEPTPPAVPSAPGAAASADGSPSPTAQSSPTGPTTSLPIGEALLLAALLLAALAMGVLVRRRRSG